jgi:nucleoside-diphosphate-sugar epimerase
LFTDAILQGRPIKLFNHGQMRRDFTYIDDVVEAVVRLLRRPPKANPKWSGDAPDPATSRAPWHVYNIGNSQTVEVTEVVWLIRSCSRCSQGMSHRHMPRWRISSVPSDSDLRLRSRREFAASSLVPQL